MQVLVEQLSGLGNQLFQYAAGRFFANANGGDLHVLTQPVENSFSHGVSPRPVLLQEFSIKAPLSEITRAEALILSQRRSVQAVRPLIAPLLGIRTLRESHAQRYHFVGNLPLVARARRLYLAGYWQAYSYASAVEEELRREFQFKTPPSGENARLVESIRATPNSVSLHIRRGDYTLAAEGNIALPMGYYDRAITLIQQKLFQPTFFIFSDDLAFAEEHLPKDIKRVFVHGNDHYSSHEDLRLMSSCQHNIIANSTFSWWGAWLNSRADKLVIAPRHWHLTPASYYPDLLPADWILLDSLRTT